MIQLFLSAWMLDTLQFSQNCAIYVPDVTWNENLDINHRILEIQEHSETSIPRLSIPFLPQDFIVFQAVQYIQEDTLLSLEI